MTMDEARQIAAQAWCDPETSGIEMDVRLAEAFAKRLVASRSSSGSGEREALKTEVAKLTAQRTMTVHRLGGKVEGAPTHVGNFLQRIDALRAIESDSGERVRALEALLRECAESMEARPEDPGLQTMARAARRALSPQGDGGTER